MSNASHDVENDPDIAAELRGLKLKGDDNKTEVSGGSKQAPNFPISLHIVDGSHVATSDSAWLLQQIGGGDVIHRLTDAFYQKVFQDAHLAQFFASFDDPHAERLGNWIIEKMGGGPVWTKERKRRPQVQVTLAGGHKHVVHDRSSAHVAAWHSPKRQPSKGGNRMNNLLDLSHHQALQQISESEQDDLQWPYDL
ncbi:hypothetical protein CYMTET_6133 [Cymbomonas tetramitiformis]|uniref:Uncharacterized protein n=1 Tax=Cymbomonas tetramitiformis TaxID=36881 RepID=A0AAE0GXV5_9CHLO|nr:hypothetical protein CYMTET_6133 [Cymbomonas tetramitiformis]